MSKKNKQKNKQTNPRPHQPQMVKKDKSPEMLELEKEIEQLKSDLLKQRNEKADLDRQKQIRERELKTLQTELVQQKQKITDLEKSAFEVREAVRKIGELNLFEFTETADEDLLVLVQAGNKPKTQNEGNDDKALAVAARYKLNDLIFYTEDKNLKNKATSMGIKTA